MMRKVTLLMSVLFLMGCVSTSIPNYLKDDHPYKKRYYKDFDHVLDNVTKALEELGWTVSGVADPYMYEKIPDNAPGEGKKILLFTEIRQTPLFMGTRYAKLNVYIRFAKDTTEVEIRYLTLSSLSIKNIKSYRNDAAVERIFKKITKLVEG